jgi:rubredoxin
MEPSTKRLRILQSLEVDETNPDYVQAKQKQQQKLKGRFESIFEKYGNMHESMSDVIDMRENRVVEDNGHIRRLNRRLNRKEAKLLDIFGLAAGKEVEDEQSDSGQDGQDSEDELAPTQPVKSSRGINKRKRSNEVTTTTSPLAASLEGKTHDSLLSTPMVAPILPIATPNTPNPAANLLQLVQFPQTPAGQQAQTSFYATLAQTINQAVQQAVAPLFSGVLSKPPNVQLPFAHPLGVPTTPLVNNDPIAPATDPKWFFPPLSAESKSFQTAQSSPIPPTQKEPTLEVDITEATGRANTYEEQEPQLAGHAGEIVQNMPTSVAAMRHLETRSISNTNNQRRTSPRVEIRHKRRRPGGGPKYHFTKEDDIYISRQKVLHNRSWLEIKAGKEKWRSWPMATFHNRWSSHLKKKNLHLKAPFTSQAAPGDRQSSEESSYDLPSNHLPTPSSLEHTDSSEPVEDTRPESTNAIPSSGTHFDDDELELLSLAGADSDGEQLPTGADEDGPFFPDADEMILPSVELTDFVDEDTLQQGLLDDSPPRNITPTVETIASTSVKTEIQMSSPTSKRTRIAHPIAYQAVADSEVEDDEVETHGSGSSPKRIGSYVCNVCGSVYQNAKKLQQHQVNPRSTHDKLPPRFTSIDLVGDDELQASAAATPPIKREFSTPPPTSFLFSTPAPHSRLHADVPSSGVKSASGLSRKAYLKQVKQSWTKKSTPGPRGLAKRKSFHTLPRKQAWAGDASDDELGI